MKKILILCLVLSLLLPVISLGESTDETVFYFSDFTATTGEWYPRGTETLISQTETGLLVSGRKKKSDGPAIDLSIESGKLYSFTVQIMQDAKSAVDFSLTIEHQKQGHISYTKFDTVTAPRGEWTAITGEWLAEAFDNYTLTLTTTGSKVTDFTVGSVRIIESDPYKLTAADYEGELPSLKAVSAGLFDFGTCMSGADARNIKRAALVASQYNIITPENELKPDSVLDVTASKKLAQADDTQVAVHFSSAIPILNFARDNGLKVHGHVLVWHSQTPEEFFHVGYDRNKPYVSREVMLARLENYIRLVFTYMDENYPGLFASWDVANECVADGATTLRSSNWTKVVGYDFVERAFEYADKYAPADVLLCYNDYSTPYEPKLTGIVKLLTTLTEQGHIDGYGFQTHYASNDPSVSAVRTAFEKIAALGLRLRVSEMDITVTADTDITRKAQADKYAELMQLYAEYADVLEAVQVWGVCDGTSWIKEKYPLPFDSLLQPKPAFFSIVDTLQAAGANE